MRISIDTGGTFTDCVYLRDGRPEILKLPSTPDDPARPVLEAVRQIAGDESAEVRHGTTIGTNALLERRGARVAFVTTKGFEDTIAIGRQARRHLYDWMATPAPSLVPEPLRFGVGERVSAEGEILCSPSDGELHELAGKIRASGAESIAVSLLHSFRNPENERKLAACLADLGLPISVSHQILPEFREYERAATVVVNAYLTPKAGAYVRRLEAAIRDRHGGLLYVMQSSGGIISARVAAEQPVRTVLSGPAGGVIGAHRIAQLAGFQKIISFDMGGTSTDVSLIDRRGPQISTESAIGEIPVSVPMLDIHTAGAGGGSLAGFDRGGVLEVGPRSAGADPGPIAYGRGTEPTVTDANLVLGRLDSELALAGTIDLDAARTRRLMEESRGAIASLERFASGILRVVEAEMERAIRLISLERGNDPREFTLVAFGGAGPLHACALARALKIPRVMVPLMAGALSALGILSADIVRDYSRTVMIPLDGSNRPDAARSLEVHFTDLEIEASAEFRREGLAGVCLRSADLRYLGQGYEINVPAGGNLAGENLAAQFHDAHRKRYGHSNPAGRVEVVNVRVRMISSSAPIDFARRPAGAGDPSRARVKKKRVVFEDEWVETGVFDRNLLVPGDCLTGPAIVHEYSATTVVPPGCRARVDEYSNLVIEV
ncbi:MAG: hydantoinase/oxoprolinase family protein [Acidobacteria bacterium]|nr:hydantoinase/oxoprolinase family protein [Acidobacteriota bacterium]